MHIFRLKWFLYYLSLRLVYRSRKHRPFQRAICDKKLIIQIKISDAGIYRYFQFHQGEISTAEGFNPTADLILTFKDAAQAHYILRHALWDMPRLIKHIHQGSLTVQGDMGVLIWFSALYEWITHQTHATAYAH